MCGISGIIHKNSLANDRPDVGSELVNLKLVNCWSGFGSMTV